MFIIDEGDYTHFSRLVIFRTQLRVHAVFPGTARQGRCSQAGSFGESADGVTVRVGVSQGHNNGRARLNCRVATFKPGHWINSWNEFVKQPSCALKFCDPREVTVPRVT